MFFEEGTPEAMFCVLLKNIRHPTEKV